MLTRASKERSWIACMGVFHGAGANGWPPLPAWISDIQDLFGTEVMVMLQDSGTTSNLRLSFGETMVVVFQILSYNSVCVSLELLIVGFKP